MRAQPVVTLLCFLGACGGDNTLTATAGGSPGSAGGPGADGGAGGGGSGSGEAPDLGVSTDGAIGDAGAGDQGFPKGDATWPMGVASVPVVIPRTNIDASAAVGAQLGGDLAIDPTNTPYYNHLIAASENTATDHVGLYETNDGATNWRTQSPAAPAAPYTGATRHPSVAYDGQGNAYCSMIAFDPIGGGNSVVLTTRLAGAGGFGKLTAVPGATSADRQRLAADRAASSPYVGRVYLAWSDGQHVRLVASSDTGASWSTAVQVDDDGTSVTDPYVTVAADGTVYVAWHDLTRNQLRIDRSVDGGVSFGGDHLIHALASSGYTSSLPAAPSAGARNAVFCDVFRANGALHNAVYCAYHDSSPAGLDVFLRRSFDGGATWSEPLQLGADAPGVPSDQFLPRVMIDDTNGKVAVSWYDTRDDAARQKTNVYFTRANDGSLFVTPVKITTALTDETRPGADAAAFGESMGMEAFLGRVRLFWTDSRTGDEEVMSLIIDFAHFTFVYPGSGTVTVPSGGSGTMAVGVQPVSGFASDVTLSTLNLPAGASASFSPNPVAENGTSTMTITAPGVAPGTYTARVKGVGGGEQDSREFTLVIQ